MITNKELYIETKGRIIKKLPNSCFLVRCENEEIITASLSRRKRLIENDRVLVKITIKDPTKGKIISLI